MKFRSLRDIRLLREYGKLSDDELPGNQIPEPILLNLINRNVIIPLEDMKKMFLVELLVTILYNYTVARIFASWRKTMMKTTRVSQ